MKHYKILFITLLIVSSIVSCKQTTNVQENKETSSEAHEDDHAEGVELTKQQFDALQMTIDTLSEKTMSGYVEANGQLEVPPQNEATVTATIGANVASINVIEGDKVSKNQVLAYLSHPDIISIQTQYLSAYNNMIFLEKDYLRQKKLYNEGVASGMSFQEAEAKYTSAKTLAAGLESQLQLLNLSAKGIQKGTIYQKVALKSPIDGYVQKVEVKTGQFVDPQTELFEIVDTHHVHADLMVFEKDVALVKKGQTVRFQIQTQPDKDIEATIYSIGKTFEDGPKAVHVHAEIENKSGSLIPGMYIQGQIETSAKKQWALPESALVKEGDSFYVFQATQEGESWHFNQIPVTTGTTNNGWMAINFLEPIAPNTLFATNNAYYLLAEKNKSEAEHTH
ncbi:efflux RND transporter periplasmic adaptor subunit [Corallibacter sp.]|uniref:efflux RND transporter periplasmic adaptor subunit n=1 Tax=Corallibacter sp. TaxID=2038084 RepID=UPI003AB5A0BE